MFSTEGAPCERSSQQKSASCAQPKRTRAPRGRGGQQATRAATMGLSTRVRCQLRLERRTPCPWTANCKGALKRHDQRERATAGRDMHRARRACSTRKARAVAFAKRLACPCVSPTITSRPFLSSRSTMLWSPSLRSSSYAQKTKAYARRGGGRSGWVRGGGGALRRGGFGME
eukprot:6179701-Pleurochrysis_carterae.AAC.1